MFFSNVQNLHKPDWAVPSWIHATLTKGGGRMESHAVESFLRNVPFGGGCKTVEDDDGI